MARHLRNLVVLGCLIASIPALADTVVVGATRDNSIYSNDGAKSNGAGQNMFVGINNDAFVRRALIQFDIAGAVPAGSTINSVTLTLSLTRTQVGNVSIGLHAVKEAWGEAGSVASGEGGGGAMAQPNDATWTKRISPSTAWTMDGGDYAQTASATTTVANTQQAYSWSSAQMTADVQGWLTDAETNFGLDPRRQFDIAIDEALCDANDLECLAATEVDDQLHAARPVRSALLRRERHLLVGAQSRHRVQRVLSRRGGTSCSPNPCPQPQPIWGVWCRERDAQPTRPKQAAAARGKAS